MLKNRIKAIILGCFILVSSTQQVWAGDASQTSAVVSTEETEENAVLVSSMDEAKDSVVQIVVEYVDASGYSYILKSGSGFLINETTILTNYDLLKLTAEETAAAESYLSTVLGKAVSFSQAEGAEQIAYSYGVVMYRDVIITATVNNYSSNEMHLGILNISEPLSRGVAVLGDSDVLSENMAAYALGYKDVTVMQADKKTEVLTQKDIKVSEGTVTGLTDADIQSVCHTAVIKNGSNGGPTVDENGTVIGMNIAGDMGGGSYVSLAVNEIKALLDSCDITYSEKQVTEAVSKEQIDEARSGLGQVDKSLLDDYILNYSMLEKGNYTKESYQALEEALNHAYDVKADETVTQTDVDAAVAQLSQARTNLVEASKVNWPFIIALSVIILAIVIGLILYILKLKGIIFKKKDPERLMTLSEIEMQKRAMPAGVSMANAAKQPQQPEIAIPRPKNSGRIVKAPAGNYNETTVLNVGNAVASQEGTVVLSASGSLESYLFRKNTSEKIRIDSTEFLIGKDRGKVNYCISDNPSISRTHAKIVVREGKCYLSDMKSTNYTYLNDRVLGMDENVMLEDGDCIRFSNEEFLFHQ